MNIRYEELRKENNYTQIELAKILNVKNNTYSKWESLTNDMSITKCNELANFYHVSLDYLLGLSNTKTNENIKEDINLGLLPIRMRELRKNHNITQKELGNYIDLNQRTYSHYEDGSRIPTTIKLLKIANFYHASFDYLVGKTNKKSN